ncbi:hypothetical protein SBA4_1630015 [Candidatus Sulfopaludibacter sp. SbA4]|nr:hypothetical protein SBA4_1630015 [Candidatus Sulfopaludibacter sp. SbA4]
MRQPTRCRTTPSAQICLLHLNQGENCARSGAGASACQPRHSRAGHPGPFFGNEPKPLTVSGFSFWEDASMQPIKHDRQRLRHRENPGDANCKNDPQFASPDFDSSPQPTQTEGVTTS